MFLILNRAEKYHADFGRQGTAKSSIRRVLALEIAIPCDLYS
ncbi:MAG: hypothetical protein VX435_10005 [Planctomycetota bacterium]|nr:hypothetical protein [Planctomycetota bacterium]